MRRGPILLPLLLVLLACVHAALRPPRAEAQSVFGVRGPGLTNQVAEARARALGTAGIALVDTLRGNLVNPSMAAGVRETTFGITLMPVMTWAEDPFVSESWGNMSLFSAWLYVPVRPRWVVVTGLRVERSTRGEVLWTESYGGSPVERRFRRDGDHFALPLALAVQGKFDAWSASVGIDFLFASLVEELNWEFSGTGFGGSAVRRTESLKEAAPALALGWKFGDETRIGLTYRHNVTLDGHRETRVEAGSVIRSDASLEYPRRVGAGVTARIWGVLASGDLTWEDWGSTSEADHVDDSYSGGFGIEAGGGGRRLPVLGKQPLRAGVRHTIHPETSFGDGSRLDESILSLGTGWIIGGGIAVLDMSFEGGVRGSIEHQGARERLFRVAVSLSGREPWRKAARVGRS